MSLVKLLLISTAVGAVAVTSPIAFMAGRMIGQNEQKKRLVIAGNTGKVGTYKYDSLPTPWSGQGK